MMADILDFGFARILRDFPYVENWIDNMAKEGYNPGNYDEVSEFFGKGEVDLEPHEETEPDWEIEFVPDFDMEE